jgi:hypothetical protein
VRRFESVMHSFIAGFNINVTNAAMRPCLNGWLRLPRTATPSTQ